ncbi:hypothetical protein Nepgr_002219 [Nepenthes gracilis]|uniref:Rho-GAP domain-containing protein n=1 Tax=Nepenthes gracilis TaxID=150966 RepID=A0AAD3RYB4_NEPGR|nr:hypothetical protein Nepgr_002219 [Nepenthes gracilis]
MNLAKYFNIITSPHSLRAVSSLSFFHPSISNAVALPNITMTLLFRSKSFELGGDPDFKPSSTPSYSVSEEEEEGDIEDEEYNEAFEFYRYSPISTPFVCPSLRKQRDERSENHRSRQTHHQFPIWAVVAAALRKSLVTCSVDRGDVSSMDISWPTDVRHISHVTFDRFNGFLGLPVELEPEVPTRVPSASVSVFGVSPWSMQCSIDQRGNSIPTILLMMQKRLYAEGGLQAEGIFRINAENSHEESVRSQINKGIIPRGIDVHCLAGLIKAWFRELPTGVLDSLQPEQVMHCNSEAQCTELVKLLPPTEAALLDWAINLMVDVVQNECQNKMNARNIAMVFAPNMTQMADPLTALIHAVQVMNFLKTLIMKTLQEREESAPKARLFSAHSDSADIIHPYWSVPNLDTHHERMQDSCIIQPPNTSRLLRTSTLDRLEFSSKQKHPSLDKKYDDDDKLRNSISGGSSPIMFTGSCSGANGGEVVGILDRLNFRKGVKNLCRHPVFQLSKPVKKNGGLLDSQDGGGTPWA